MTNGAEAGRTLYFTSFQDEVGRPQWRETYTGEMILARGYFVSTADSGENVEPFPLVMELNPEISEIARERMKTDFEAEGAVVVTAEQFQAAPFDEAYVQGLLGINDGAEGEDHSPLE